MFRELFILITKSLRYRPLRGWLTVLGVVIAVMLVVIILSLSDGIQRAVAKALQTFGPDLMVIMPGKESNPLLGLLAGQKFKEVDLLSLEKIPGVKFVVPMEVTNFTIEHGGEKKSVMFHAQKWEHYIDVLESSQGIRLVEGRWPESDQAREVVAAYGTAYRLFKEKISIGDEITIKSRRFKVVGIISLVGDQMIDNLMYMSMNHYRDLTGSRTAAGSALVKIQPGYSTDLLAQQIRYELDKQEEVRDFSILTPEKAGQLVGNVLSIIQIVLMTIALVSLLVGAVGIMNTMYTSVLERTKQIGIMKAVGASGDAILSLFLLESGIIGFVGGLLGILLGVFSAYLIGVAAGNFGVRGLFVFSSLDFGGFAALVVFTFVTGVVSGVLPARQAASLEPAEALRYE